MLTTISIDDAVAYEGDEAYRFLDVFVDGEANEMKWLKGMAVGPDGAFYISSADTNSIYRVDNVTGNADEFIASGTGGLAFPLGLTFGPDGHLYVCSRDNGTVLRFNGSNGAALPAPGAPGAEYVRQNDGDLQWPTDLFFRTDGSLYVSAWYPSRVLRFEGPNVGADAGKFIDTFIGDDPGTPEDDTGGLGRPKPIGYGPDGNFYVGDYNGRNILRYDTDGNFLDVFIDGATQGGLVKPSDFEFQPDGSMYVSGEGGEETRVLRYDAATGEYQGDVVPEGMGRAHRAEGFCYPY